MKSIRKLNSMVFDAAPPLGLFIVVGAIFIIPLLILLVLFAVWLVRKAVAGKKANADTGSGDNALGSNRQ